MNISVTRLSVRYAETDKMGITHHSVYPIYCEQARTDYIKQFGLTYSQMEQSGVMVPLADLRFRYLGSTTYEDELEIRTAVTRLSAAKVRFSYQIFKAGQDRPVCVGYTTHGWVDTSSFRPVNLKKAYPELYRLFSEALEPEFEPKFKD